jgi:t-SNARE complex subunit (syntaxin)
MDYQIYYEDIDERELLIDERELLINNIESEISDIHDIFVQLNTNVNEQGHLLDYIESNTNIIIIDLENSENELSKAIINKKKTSKCLFYIFLLFFSISILIILII